MMNCVDHTFMPESSPRTVGHVEAVTQGALNPGSLLFFFALPPPLPSSRVLGKLGLESTPINTKGYETLLTLVSTPHPGKHFSPW